MPDFFPPTAEMSITPIDSNTVFLCRFHGANGSSTYTDSSANSIAITSSGSPTITTSRSLFLGSSIRIQDGAYVETGANDLFKLTGDFTIDFWTWRDSSGLVTWPTIFELGLYTDGILFRPRNNDDIYINNVNYGWFSFPNDCWLHVAVVRLGTAVNVYVNGASVKSMTVSGTINAAGNGLRIGSSRHATGQYTKGNFDEFRVSRVARYNGSFVPPSSPTAYDYDVTVFLANFNGQDGATSFTDAARYALSIAGSGAAKISTTQSKFGGASLYLDGAGSYLTVADNAVLDASGDFTIEAWVYPTDFSQVDGNNRTILSFASTTIDSTRPCIQVNSSGQVLWYSGSAVVTTVSSLTLNQWSHVAFVRSGTNLSAFINGCYQGAANYSTAITPDQILIGRSTNSVGDFVGYIDDLRISKVARYSSRGFFYSTQSSPTQSLNNLPEPTVTLGSDLINPAIYIPINANCDPATVYATSNVSISLGSSIGAEIIARVLPTTEAEVGSAISVGTSGSGSGTAPTTGQIFPRGTN